VFIGGLNSFLHLFEMNRFFSCKSAVALFCASFPGLYAGQTRIWSQGDFTDFQKGVLKNLSLRSDGVVTLAPRSEEFYDSSAMYLWGLARDSKGNLYAGGGTGAKLYRIGPDGKGKMLAELDALEIHAVALDSKDRVYVATAPDGKVYRVSSGGKADVFYDPKSKYIWAMAFDRQDNLFVATGDPGEIHRVAPDGTGKVFFRSEETHVRSLAFDAKGNLIAGTAPGGLVLRVSPAGEGFVLYQMSKPEVTAVAVAPAGSIYAAAVGSRQTGAPPPPTLAPAPPPSQITINAGGIQVTPRQTAPSPLLSSAPVPVSGGSEVYRIASDGEPRRMWSNSQDVVYAIAFDAAGRALLGTGNKGNIYRIESPTTYTALLTVPTTQVTAFQAGPGGRLYAAAGNVGKIYEIDATPESQGTMESDLFDAGLFTRWGRLSFDAKTNGAQISIQTRSGNLDQPQKNWSPWSAPISDPKGAAITSPPARFLQWKATLTASAGSSPELDSVDVAYLPKNVEPRVEKIEVTPANYKFPPPSGFSAPSTLNLPALSLNNRQSLRGESNAPAEIPSTNTPAMQYAKGWIGARWVAGDPNGDSLIFTVEIRGIHESEWKPLKDKLTEKYYSWDSTAFPDGQYVLRVTASDSPSNPPDQALTGDLVSEAFLIDNTPPKITALTAMRNGTKLEIHWHAADALSNLTMAEYSLDGGDWTVAAPNGGISDSPELDYSLTLDAPPGEHTVAVRVEDAYDNQSVEKTVLK
jgi:sugar lactone lactonase YvrE